MVLDLLKLWTGIAASRRIELKIEPGAASRTRPAVYQWNACPARLARSLISSLSKLEAGSLLLKMKYKNV